MFRILQHAVIFFFLVHTVHAQIPYEIVVSDNYKQNLVSSDRNIKGLTLALQDPSPNVRIAALKRLEEIPWEGNFPDHSLSIIASQITSSQNDLTIAAIDALGSRKTLGEPYLGQIAALLTDEDRDVRSAAVKALGRQETLGEPYLGQIAALLTDEDSYVRCSAIDALGSQKNLSESYLQQIVPFLKYESRYIRQSAIDALTNQEFLLDNILQQVVAILKSENSDVRHSAVKFLGNQETLGEPYLDQIAALLTDGDSYVRCSAIYALGSQKPLSEPYLGQIATLLKNKDSGVRRAAVKALGRQKILNEPYLSQITILLQNSDRHVRRYVIDALGSLETLSEPYLGQIAALLTDGDSNVRSAAVKALGSQKPLSEPYLGQIAALLKDEDSDVRSTTVKALGSQKPLSEPYLGQIAALLKDGDSYVRRSTIYALAGQKPLSEPYLGQIATLLKDEDSEYVRRAAVSFLCNQEFSNDAYIQQFVSLLKDEDRFIRHRIFDFFYHLPVQFWYDGFPYIADYALLTNDNTFKEPAFQFRVPLYEVSGGNDSLIFLLKWFCRPSKYPSDISIEEARKTLDLTIGLKPYFEDNPLFFDEVGKVLPELVRITESGWSAKDITRLQAGLTLIREINPIKADYIHGLIRSLQSRRWLIHFCWVAGIHILLWTLLIFLYPYSLFIQTVFFWNPKVRTWGGLGYVGFLIAWLPFLRKRMFLPFKENLISEAFPNTWQKEEYFSNTQVYSIKDKRMLSVSEALLPLRGRVILQGESGLGKTMFLRNLVVLSPRLVAYLPANKCIRGIIPAIQQKIQITTTDPLFLTQLIHAGSIDILVDGLNEVSASTCAQLTAEIERDFKGNLLLTTQPMEWAPPALAKIYQLKPLTKKQIQTFLLSRYPYLDQLDLLPESAYQKNCEAYLEKTFDSKLDKTSLRTNLLILSNPMELVLVAQLIARGENPSILDLQEQQYELMAEYYKYTNLGNNFPLAKFSKEVYQMRINDQPEIPAEAFQKEILALQHWKMAVSRQTFNESKEKPVKQWYFRHDKIMDFFLVQEFLANQALCEKHLDDPRFRGVYFLLASKLDYEDAMKLREQIIQHAVDTKDHTLSDNFIQLIRGRRKPRKKIMERFREDILNTIAYGQSDKAIQLLRSYSNGEHEQSAVILENRETVLRRKIMENTISSEAAQLERNQINRAIIDLAQMID